MLYYEIMQKMTLKCNSKVISSTSLSSLTERSVVIPLATASITDGYLECSYTSLQQGDKLNHYRSAKLISYREVTF